jgi:hypothetical protein
VDALARAFISLSGLSLTNVQAREIKDLYQGLEEYDKRPLLFQARTIKPSRGQFARSKGNRYGHVTTEAMPRGIQDSRKLPISVLPIINHVDCNDSTGAFCLLDRQLALPRKVVW